MKQEVLKCVIVDDEPLARRLVAQYVGQTPGLELSTSFGNPSEALSYLISNRIDLLFADIEMPGFSGMELIEGLPHPPAVVFITAFQDHALGAFELGAVDYLLKPVVYERFLLAVEKAKTLLKASSEKEPDDSFFVKAEHKIHKISFKDVLYIEGMREYIKICTENKNIMPLASLNKMIESMPQYFMRVHRSYIINLNKIMQIDGNYVIVGDQAIPIGKSYKESLMRFIDKRIL